MIANYTQKLLFKTRDSKKQTLSLEQLIGKNVNEILMLGKIEN
jgi:hypothetical protein